MIDNCWSCKYEKESLSHHSCCSCWNKLGKNRPDNWQPKEVTGLDKIRDDRD